MTPHAIGHPTAWSPVTMPDGDPVEALLHFAEPIASAHALIVADHGLDLLCALIRRGCLAATCIRAAAKADAPAYDLVVVPSAPDTAALDHAISVARHALTPGGRVIIGLPRPPVADGLLLSLVRRLKLNGFRALRTRTFAGRAMVTATLPADGSLS